MQADGNKIIDPNKKNALCSRLRMELWHPLRVAVVNRGPDTELLVANPIELSGRGRPLVFYDITLALETLNARIFSVLSNSLSSALEERDSWNHPHNRTLTHRNFLFSRWKSGDTWYATGSGKCTEF